MTPFGFDMKIQGPTYNDTVLFGGAYSPWDYLRRPVAPTLSSSSFGGEANAIYNPSTSTEQLAEALSCSNTTTFPFQEQQNTFSFMGVQESLQNPAQAFSYEQQTHDYFQQQQVQPPEQFVQLQNHFQVANAERFQQQQLHQVQPHDAQPHFQYERIGTSILNSSELHPHDHLGNAEIAPQFQEQFNVFNPHNDSLFVNKNAPPLSWIEEQNQTAELTRKLLFPVAKTVDCRFPQQEPLNAEIVSTSSRSSTIDDQPATKRNEVHELENELVDGFAAESSHVVGFSAGSSQAAIGLTAESTRALTVSDTSTGQRTSKYRGVTRHRWTRRYEAHLWDNSFKQPGKERKGRQVYLGGYDNEEAAARAYDLAALKYWGPTTILNFPLSNYSKEIEEMRHKTRQEYVAAIRRKSDGFSRGTSVYRGVTRHHQHGRWQARIGRVAGHKDLYLGTFGTEEEAAEAYDRAAIRYRGLKAITNFEISRYVKVPKEDENGNLLADQITPKHNANPDWANYLQMFYQPNQALWFQHQQHQALQNQYAQETSDQSVVTNPGDTNESPDRSYATFDHHAGALQIHEKPELFQFSHEFKQAYGGNIPAVYWNA